VRRRLFNLAGAAAAVSVLLFVATVVSWARTRGTIEWVEYARADRWFRLVVRPSGVFLSTAASAQPETGFSVGRHQLQFTDFLASPSFNHFLGFSMGTFGWDAETVTYLLIPYWFAALATTILPGLWALRWWGRRHARVVGLCRSCGYDLRATPDRCPECGEVPSGHASPVT
jgi:hypothetical protein